MADWYASSANYNAVAQWAASTAYTIGQLVRSLAAPAQPYAYYVQRCTTAGTTGATEPGWAPTNNGTTASGTATFTNVTGQSTYGWSAAAGNLYSLGTAGLNRPVVGDRIFIASDHTETLTTATYAFTLSAGFVGVSIISVNRAGSVPPVTADELAGAALNILTGSLIFDAVCPTYWQGLVITYAGTNFWFNSGQTKSHYFKNCAFILTSTSAIKITNNNPVKVTFDNTTVKFGAVGQGIAGGGYAFDFTWINTPSAIQGPIFPTALFGGGSSTLSTITCRGLDLSTITGALLGGSGIGGHRVLLDSCKISTGVTRYLSSGANDVAGNEIELVNCHDGTNVINERYVIPGTVATDRSTYLPGGAQDDIGAYSLKLASNTNTDRWALPLDCFVFDIENTSIGAAKTATIEVISTGSLNNNDVRLLLEYMGGGLATTVWDVSTGINIALSGGNLTAAAATNAAAQVRGSSSKTTGKYYHEVILAGPLQNSAVGISTSSPGGTTLGPTLSAYVNVANCVLFINGSSLGNIFFSNPIVAGDIVGIATDLMNKRIWFRKCPSGLWNDNASYNPATNTGGFDISSVFASAAALPVTTFTGTGLSHTANFGASTFSGAVPAGFTAGWPADAPGSSSIASFVNSLPSTLTTPAALPTSSATWTASTQYSTLNPLDTVGALSNGNLTFTGAGGVEGSRSTFTASAGKFYWEATMTTWVSSSDGPGIAVTIGSPTGSVAAAGVVAVGQSGSIWLNGSNTGSSLGALTSGNIVGIAADFTSKLIWFRLAPSGNWNGSGTANPATGVGGINFGVLSGTFAAWISDLSAAPEVATVNFGASAFSGAVPSGFTAGLPLTPTVKQKLQVTFTPQRAGRVRGLVRLGKPSTTVWVNPQIAIA